MTDIQPALDRISDLLRSRRKPQPSYFVVCCEYRTGHEAVVDPQMTRADVVALIKSGEYQNIEFIHHIADGLAEDVTAELLEAAELELKTEARDRADQIAAERDHAQDHRKNWVSA